MYIYPAININMPRLSLYKPERGQDYRFIDRQVSEMFQVGGTDLYLHKYIGPKNPSTGTADQPIYDQIKPTNIQDMLFLENRDRKYDSEIYRIRGIYNVQNIDFNLSQFGLFIDNDTLFMTVHINDFIKYVGRKPISGDVFELPHLVDQFALNDYDVSLPRYYVIEDVGRASEGFSATWYPHLYRLKCVKITGNQQFADILKTPTGEDLDKFVGDYVEGTVYLPGQIVRVNGVLYQVKEDGSVPSSGTNLTPPDTDAWTLYSGNTLEAILSTRAKELEISDSVLRQAEADAPKSGYETRQFYTLSVDEKGRTLLETTDQETLDASSDLSTIGASTITGTPQRNGYTGYLLGDGFPTNGYDFGHGIQFPAAPGKEDFFLRTDFMPNRLFRFDGTRWIKMEDNVQMSMTNDDNRSTQKTGFINNNQYTYVDELGFDSVRVTAGATYIDTNINFVEAPYVTIRYVNTVLDFAVKDYPNIIEAYTVDDVEKVRINMPVINGEQQQISISGVWQVGLYNHREAQRQSLSQALKPKADL